MLLVTFAATAADKRSGYDDASRETRAMQDDDFANPAFLWVRRGEGLWSRADVPAGKSCASCHGEPAAMRGVAARQPAFDAAAGRPMNLDERIQRCRTERQGAPAFAAEGDDLLALSALVGLQSRGLPMSVAGDGPAAPFLDRGRQLFATRHGQLNLSCAQCHDGRAGEKLAGNVIPQGHPNGYPLYRLEWQSIGSLGRRLRNCMTGIRAEPFAPGSEEAAALELYLGWRATGLRMETPAVRP
ncbi:MAG: sulfur oxidation c-type cytochrome SoxA [Alphaproteobacteria bacterium]